MNTSSLAVLPDISNVGLYNPCEGSLFYIVPSPAENLCTNPSFEYDTTGWTSTGTINRVSSGYSEHFALQASLTTNQSVTYALPVNPTTVIHAASLYILNTGSSAVQIALRVADSIQLATRAYTIYPGRWERLQVSFIGRNASTTLQVIAGQACTIKLDACQIEISSVGATTYFDGNSLGTQQNNQIQYQQYGWVGDTHASVSYRNRQTTNGGQIIDLHTYGFQLVSISGAGNPTFENAILTFASTDGGVLQDTVVPPRDVSMVGRISASTKTELHQKLQQFMQLFQRDQVAYYQARSWRFQHMNGRDLIGQEISFSGVLVSVVAAEITDQLSVEVVIQINMIDPYFYGHDVSVEASDSLFYGVTSSPVIFDWIDTYQVGSIVTNATQGRFQFNGAINGMVTYNGRCYIVGAFTSITDTVTSTVYAHSYWTVFDSQTNTFIAPPAAINALIRTIDISPNGKYIAFGGDFTTVGAQTCNRIAMYTISTNTFSRIHPTYIGVNATVWSIKFGTIIRGTTWDYNIYFGGTFTTGDVVGTLNRLAYFGTVTTAIGTGVNGDVYTVAPDESTNTLVFGGAFLASTSGVNMRRIGSVNLSTIVYTAFNFGVDGNVNEIVFKSSGQGFVCGSFNNFLVNASGAVSSACSRLLKYTSLTLSSIPIPVASASFIWVTNPEVRNLRIYQNGITYTRQYVGTSIVYTYYYNDSNGITYQLPLGGAGIRYHDTQYNRTYYAITSGTTRATPKPFVVDCDSTTKSRLFFRLRLLSQYSGIAFADNTISVFSGLQNLVSQEGVYISPTTTLTNTSTMLEMFPYIYFGDVITLDVRVGQITSFYYNLLSELLPTSALYTLSLLPGNNVIQAYILQGDYSLSTANPEVCVGYTQTYQNIFDGINRI